MVSKATVTKHGNELLEYFIQSWLMKHKKDPEINRFKDKWGFQDMVKDLGLPRSKDVIDYYFRTDKVGHPLQYLFYNYERFNRVLREQEKDAQDREELRRETEKRVREWLNGDK